MNEQLKVIISAEIGKFKQNVDSAKKQIKDFVKEGTKDFEALNEEFQKVGEKSKTVLKVMGGAIAGAATALLALGGSTKEYRQQQAQLATAFEVAGGSAKEAKQTYNDLYRVLGDSGQATEAAQHLAKLTTEEKALAEYTNICKGVYAQFGSSLPIESLTEAINHTSKIGEVQGTLADALEWSGVSLDEFNEQLFWCNTESEREKLIRDTLNGLYTESAEAYEKNNAAVLAQNDAQIKLTDALATLGEAVEPVITDLTLLATDVLAQLMPYIQEFSDKYGDKIKETLVSIGDAIGRVINWIADNWELVSTLAIIIAAISAALTVFSVVMGVVNAVMYASPVTWIVLAIVAAIAALVAIIVVVIKHWDTIKDATTKAINAMREAIQKGIDTIKKIFNSIIDFVKNNWQGLLLILVNPFAAAFKLLYDNCEGFRNTINNLLTSVKNVFTNIGNTIKEKFNTAANTIKSIIDKIKGFFKFEWSLPKLKVPKFSIFPSGWKIGDLLEGVIPKLSIAWNARGGVFDKPTLFGYGNGLQGIGENGAEAVVPLENNTEWLNKLANMLSEKMGTGAPIVLQVDGKVFAKTAVTSINNLTRQQGKMPLVIA